MNRMVPVIKDEREQQPIPSAWRSTFHDIIQAFAEGDFALARGISGVRPVSAQDAAQFPRTLHAYGARLVGLPVAGWDSSVCQWYGDYWDVMIDLYTVEEGASDLVLGARVYENGVAFEFEVGMLYVP